MAVNSTNNNVENVYFDVHQCVTKECISMCTNAWYEYLKDKEKEERKKTFDGLKGAGLPVQRKIVLISRNIGQDKNISE
ncbi:hypothetical protein ACJMK2_043511 [Sinanodonta woodiana]|uniref:Uncharacterized protein n=1 Tax=Sinanodonta woodiana TaxID=1069815 RepID=A0ABD3VZY2_SINWO